MSGDAKPTGEHPDEWFDLVDLATDKVVGQVTRLGQIRYADPEITRRITSAFDRDIMRRGDEIADQLGMCFADVETAAPGDKGHNELVFRNLGVLTGLVPRRPAETEGRASSR